MSVCKRQVVTTMSCTIGVLIVFLVGAIYYGTFASPINHSAIVKSDEQQKPGHQLRLVHIAFRHGHRTPADTYPNDPFVNDTMEPFGWGQLTHQGKRNMYEMGQWLRSRYNTFLGDHYRPDYLHAQATGVSRAHMSMANVLAALWKPKGTVMEWNKDLNWQPIPIFSEELEKDTLLLVRTSCPRYHEELNRVFRLPEVQKVFKANEYLFKSLTNITGFDIQTPDDVQSLLNTLKAEEAFGLTLPKWTEQYYPDKLMPLTDLSFVLNVYNDELKRLKGGPFLKKMFNEWHAVKTDTLEPRARKIYIYCGHDSTVVNMLAGLNVWDSQFPDYGITTIFELYENNETHELAVEIYLRNSTTQAPHLLTVPGCASLCPLDQLTKIAHNIIPVDMIQECEPKMEGFTEPPSREP